MDKCDCGKPFPRERHIAIVNDVIHEFCSLVCKRLFLEEKWPVEREADIEC